MNQYVADQYKSVDQSSEILSASGHRLVQILYEALIEKMLRARAIIENAPIDYEAKGHLISRCILILGHLKGTLDFEQGGEVAKNLEQVYESTTRLLFEANFSCDLVYLDQAVRLIKTIKEGWDGIADKQAKSEAMH
jgi:flagellar protein FliS